MKDKVIRKTTGMMAESLDQLCASYERCGIELRREISKHLISKGGPWASLCFVLQDKMEDETFSSSKVMLASFKKDDCGMFRRFSYFNIKHKEEAQKICNLLKDIFDLE